MKAKELLPGINDGKRKVAEMEEASYEGNEPRVREEGGVQT